jgi:hypothetical protein
MTIEMQLKNHLNIYHPNKLEESIVKCLKLVTRSNPAKILEF